MVLQQLDRGKEATVEVGIKCLFVALQQARSDRVALLASTRLEWVQCDSAIVTMGAVSVGIYHSIHISSEVIP